MTMMKKRCIAEMTTLLFVTRSVGFYIPIIGPAHYYHNVALKVSNEFLKVMELYYSLGSSAGRKS
jgi:hypothetical protein